MLTCCNVWLDLRCVCFCRRPAFVKLESWLENLKMHLEMGLHLVSELELIHQDFCQKHSSSKNGLHTHPEQPE